MAIYLGNLTVKELEDKHSFTLSDEHRVTLESMRQIFIVIPLMLATI